MNTQIKTLNTFTEGDIVYEELMNKEIKTISNINAMTDSEINIMLSHLRSINNQQKLELIETQTNIFFYPTKIFERK